MARRSLRPQLNQIRTWVRQGRTDAWIAHQLEASTEEIASFKHEHDLDVSDAAPPVPPPVGLETEIPEDIGERPRRRPTAAEPSEEGPAEPARKAGTARARGRRGRGGRGRGGPRTYEATFDHGEDGYGIWLDPEVVDDPTYKSKWAGQSAVTVRIEADSIVIERVKPPAAESAAS